MKSKWITHQGRQIWFADYGNFGTDAAALQVEVDASEHVICAHSENPLDVLIDVRGTVATGEVIELLKISAKHTQPYMQRSAVVGVAGVRKMMLDMVNFFSKQKMEGFGEDEMEKALDWLLSE